MNLFYQLEINCCKAIASEVSDILLTQGAICVNIEDQFANSPSEQPIFIENSNDSDLWEHCFLKVLFYQKQNWGELLAYLNQTVEGGFFSEYKVREIKDQDWVSKTQQINVPFSIGKNIWIVPFLHEPVKPEAKNIFLDPGQAFGSGTHPTTRLCLEWLEKHIKGGEKVLDYGCGSGILGIAAMILNADECFCVDIDANALETSKQNALKNEVTLYTSSPESLNEKNFDVVIANILLKPLIGLKRVFYDLLTSKGKIVFSGVLKNQIHLLQESYTLMFDFEETIFKDDWCLLSGTKK